MDETLSALLLAEEVAQVSAEWDQLSALDQSILETTGRIAEEEGRHSALAWQTLRWICQTEAGACKAIDEVLTRESKHLAMENHPVNREWDRLFKIVGPFVLRGEGLSASGIQCSAEKDLQFLSTLNAEYLADYIVERVLCGYRSATNLV